MRLIGQNRNVNVPYESSTVYVVDCCLYACPIGSNYKLLLGEYETEEDALKVFDNLMRFAKANGQITCGLYFVPKSNGDNSGIKNILAGEYDESAE